MKKEKFDMKKTIFTLVGSMLCGATLVMLYIALT
jgi:hypothetical protein|tara:strand:+ start:289 stop:390 length:102 start_codon:yes stop_codon:yes gene_type:complete